VSRSGNVLALAALLLAVPTAAPAARAVSPSPGAWRALPKPPVAFSQGPAGVWTGRRLVLFGRASVTARDARGNPYSVRSFDAAASYEPATDRWTRLSPPHGPQYVPGYDAVWTGRELLAFGAFHSVAYEPQTNAWRELRRSIPGGLVAWTGREAIGWGGGCCGDARVDGAAYDPRKDRFRTLPRSPLAPSQQPLGAWTGRELILLVSGYGPDGKRYPRTMARAAAYDPDANTWHRLPPLPQTGPRFGSVAVWDGRELLVVGAGTAARSAFAFAPDTGRWRRLASSPAGRLGAVGVWAGTRLLLWGGQRPGALTGARDGLSYDPRGDRWSTLPPAPLRGAGPYSAVWTGRSLIVSAPRAGAVFSPTTR
jgi:N-acetylneuraminic acid mutarotase